MNVVQADLPMTGANLKPSWVLAIDPLNIPVLSLAVTGEGYDPVQLRTLVENEVVNRLKADRKHPLEGSCQEAILPPYTTFDNFFLMQ